jgi:hypothetical protein
MTMPDELKLEEGWLKKATDEAAFNLRLIANAKEMLAALEQTHNLLTGHVKDMWGCNANCGDRDCTCGYYKQLSINRAIIAKAKGGRAMSVDLETPELLDAHEQGYQKTLASRDAEIAALKAEVERLREAIAEAISFIENKKFLNARSTLRAALTEKGKTEKSPTSG